MSMFDEVYLEEGIDCGCKKNVHHFQTKDLDNMLDQYTVNKDGILEVEDYVMKEPKEKRVNQFGFPVFEKVVHGFSVLRITKNIEAYTSCKYGKHWINVHLGYIQGELVSKKVNITDEDENV